MAQWRKVLVSGSSADVSSLNVGTADGTAGTIINNSSIAGSRITGSFTGSFVGDGSDLTGITATSLDIDAFGSDLTSATLAVSDLFIVSDGGTDGRANIGDLATPLAGTGLEADSNTIRIAAAAAGDGLSGGAGSALALDLNELSAAAVNVAADSIAIIDADDNSSKKESVADFVDAINGTGIDAGSGQLSITAAQTGITSVKNNALVIGGNSQNNTIDFGTDDVILFDTDSTERMRVDAAGVDITGALTTTGNITVAGAVSASAGMTGSFTGSFVGDGSNLTGVAQDIDSLTAFSGVPHATDDEFLISDNGTELRATMTMVANGAFALVSGDATIADGGALTIGADTVANSMLENMTRGTVKVGGNSNAPTDLDAKTDGQILVGDGTDIASVAVSGDVTLSNTGAVTIAADSVEGTMLNTNAADTSTIELSSDTLSVLKVPNALTAGTGIDAGGTFDGAAARTLTTAAAQTGIETIYNTSLIIGRAANDTTINFTTDDQIIFDQGSTEAMKIDSTGVTVAGNLTVNGSTTTISSTNMLVKDPFIFAASGSHGANVDGGLIVQEGSNAGTGSAIYHDTTDNRWAVAKSVEASDTAVTALEHVVTVKQLGDNDAAVESDKEYGVGEMAINSNGTIWIYS
tara:strand:- start:1146 stop:3059 length:1914 start_codon:yes stop_codon:yes gene_type:complete